MIIMKMTQKQVRDYWKSKRRDAKSRDIEFAIPLISVQNMLRAKRCYYTGITLTIRSRNNGKRAKLTDFTIDRIDSRKGYVPGNVVACCRLVNELKCRFESEGSPLEAKHFIAMSEKLKKHLV